MEIKIKDLNVEIVKEAKVKHINKLMPYQKDFEKGIITEIDLTTALIYSLSETEISFETVKEKIEDFNMKDFEKLTSYVSKLTKLLSWKKQKA